MRAWDTLWGDGGAHIVVENSYVTVSDGVVRKGDSDIRAEGLFSLGYPRDDDGEEINARFRVNGRDLDSLRHAFELDDWPVSGRLSGEFHLTGRYHTPIGFGAMTIDDGIAYGEPFQKASAALRFDLATPILILSRSGLSLGCLWSPPPRGCSCWLPAMALTGRSSLAPRCGPAGSGTAC